MQNSYSVRCMAGVKIDLEDVSELGISFEYNMNRRGPSTEPCGTPHVIFNDLEFVLLYVMYCTL